MIAHITLLLLLTTALQAEQLPELFGPIVDQFVFPKASVIVGNYTLHATSNHLFNWTHAHFTLGKGEFSPQNPIRIHVTWGPKPDENGVIEVSHFAKQPVYKFWWLGEYSSLPARPAGCVHHDDKHFFDLIYFPEKKQYNLQVLSRVGTPFDAEAVVDTLYTNVLTKKGVRPVLESHVSTLVFHKPDLSGFSSPPPRKFDDKELAQVDLSKITGKWIVHATTKEKPDHDHSVSELIHQGQALRYNLMSGTNLVAVVTHYRVADSRRTLSVYRPVAQEVKAKYAANVRSVPKHSDYLYADDNTVLTYGWCATTQTESLKVMVREGHSASDYTKAIPATIVDKIKDLLAKLKVIEKKKA